MSDYVLDAMAYVYWRRRPQTVEEWRKAVSDLREDIAQRFQHDTSRMRSTITREQHDIPSLNRHCDSHMKGTGGCESMPRWALWGMDRSSH